MLLAVVWIVSKGASDSGETYTLFFEAMLAKLARLRDDDACRRGRVASSDVTASRKPTNDRAFPPTIISVD